MSSADPGLPAGLPAPATRALTAAGYTSLSQLAGVPARDLSRLHGVGPKALRILAAALAEHGQSSLSADPRRVMRRPPPPV